MKTAIVYCDAIEVSLRTGPDMCDITAALSRIISKSDVADGHLSATMVGSTGSLTSICPAYIVAVGFPLNVSTRSVPATMPDSFSRMAM